MNRHDPHIGETWIFMCDDKAQRFFSIISAGNYEAYLNNKNAYANVPLELLNMKRVIECIFQSGVHLKCSH